MRLANDKLIALLAPAAGGHDVRAGRANHLPQSAGHAGPPARNRTTARCSLAPPAATARSPASTTASIFKQAGLDQRLQYDPTPRKSLLDHFFDLGTTPEAVHRGEANERGDFVQAFYEAKIRRAADRIQVQLSRQGHVGDVEVKITKGVTLAAGSPTLEIAYLLEGVPHGRAAALRRRAELRRPACRRRRPLLPRPRQATRLGQLGKQLDLADVTASGPGRRVAGHRRAACKLSRPTSIWTFPIETVSQSEGGFELVHQSVVCHPALAGPRRRRGQMVGHHATHRGHRTGRIAHAAEPSGSFGAVGNGRADRVGNDPARAL